MRLRRIGELSVMRKAGYGYLTVALALMVLAVLVLLPSGAGPGAFPREMEFTDGLHSSLSLTWTKPNGSGRRKNTSQRETLQGWRI